MATKAELEAEVAGLKEESRQRDSTPPPDAETAASSDASRAAAMPEGLQRALSEHGIDGQAIETMGAQLVDELVALQKEKPLVVLLGAFAVGCIVGRAFR
jgi:hypothetical protein